MPELSDETEAQIVEQLHMLIVQLVPDVQTVTKYGGTLYTLIPDEKEGQFCGVFSYQEHVQLSFAQGASLDDPAEKLAGSGKFRRHINFVVADHVGGADVAALIKAAAEL